MPSEKSDGIFHYNSERTKQNILHVRNSQFPIWAKPTFQCAALLKETASHELRARFFQLTVEARCPPTGDRWYFHCEEGVIGQRPKNDKVVQLRLSTVGNAC
jgi:hypothetical protein